MNLKSISMAVVVLTAVCASVGTSANAATANDDVAGVQLSVCEGNSLSTVDGSGAVLSDETLSLALKQVQHLCDAGVGSTITFDEYLVVVDDAAPLSGAYANVVAQINSRPGNMGISGYANAIPLDGRKKELSCIYRMQPVAGPATSWESCGAETTTSATYLTTRGNDFCPVPGTRWEAIADLYANGTLMQSDGAAAVAL